MTTYYVRKSGNDSSAGTSSGTAWLTIAKALGASGISSGDTVHIGAGIYRETVTVAMTSASAETKVLADTDGSKTGDAGDVRWTTYGTNDKTSPSNVFCLDLAGRRFLTFEGIHFHGGGSTASLIDGYTNGAPRDLTFRHCAFTYQSPAGTGQAIYWKATADVDNNFLVERCRFLYLGISAAIGTYVPQSSIAEYDCGADIINCFFLCPMGSFSGAPGVLVDLPSGFIGFNNGGGVRTLNCTYIGRSSLMYLNSSSFSTNSARVCVCKNSLILTSGAAFQAASAGTLIEDYNRLIGTSAGINVSTGSNSRTDQSHAILVNLGQEAAAGMRLKPYFSLPVESPLLGFGNDSSPTPPSVDILNRQRPSGPGFTWSSAASAAGCFEYHDGGVMETTTVDSGSNASIKVTGPSDLEFRLPVSATSTTVTVKVRRDSNYAGTNPQIKLLDCPEVGVTAQSVTDAGSANAWNTLSLAAFTPTSAGVVILRLVSTSTAGNGICYWDTISVT